MSPLEKAQRTASSLRRNAEARARALTDHSYQPFDQVVTVRDVHADNLADLAELVLGLYVDREPRP